MKKRLFVAIAMLMLLFTVAIPSAQAAPGNVRGYELNNTGYTGLRAIMSTGTANGSPPNFYFPAKSPDVHQQFTQELYPKNSCLKVEVRHDHVANSGTTQNRVWFVNLCGGSTGSFDLTDPTYRTNYVRQITWNDTGMAFIDEVIDARVWYTGTTWEADLFNYTTGVYNAFKYQSGTRTEVGYADILDNGYTQDPTMSCPTLYPWGILQLRGIQKYSSGVWSAITSGDITFNYADSWPCITANQYMITHPQVYQIKLLPYGVGY